MHKNIKDFKKKCRTRKRTKDLDQIHEDMKPENGKKLVFTEIDNDLPGGGQFYCIHCAKHCIDDKALMDHLKSKIHKRRLRLLKEKPYTQEEAEMAAGMGSYTISPKIPEPNPQKVVQMDSAGSTADESLMSP